MELKKLGLIGLLIGIPLFLSGVISALNDFEGQMNIIDWLVMDIAPSLPPQQGDLVRIIAIGLVVLVPTTLLVTIERLANRYT